MSEVYDVQGASFGFALPDPDDIWIQLAEIEENLNLYAATIRGIIDVSLGRVRGHLLDLDRVVHNFVADSNLAVWDNIEKMGAEVHRSIASDVAGIRGVASAIGINLLSTDQLAGEPITVQPRDRTLSAPLAGSIKPTVAGQWWCMRTIQGHKACVKATSALLKIYVTRGMSLISGPYGSPSACWKACSNLPALR